MYGICANRDCDLASNDVIATVYNIFRWYRSGWGRYTQADPILLAGGLNLYAYASENPVISSDSFGLYDVKDTIVLKPTLSPAAICSSEYACAKVAAAVICQCPCVNGTVFADVTLLLGGEIAYFSGPYGLLKKKPKDKSVVDKVSAVAHEYNTHILPAVHAVDGLLKQLESQTFMSEKDCYAQCSATSTKVSKLFKQVLKQTQQKENSGQ